MKRPKKNVSWFMGFLVLLLLFLPAASAEESDCPECPFKIELTAKARVAPGEPATMQIKVFNNVNDRVITRKGFLLQDYYKWVTIIGPDGPIPYKFSDATDFPFPSIPYKGRNWTPAEIIPPKGDPDAGNLLVFDARNHYQLDNAYGPITAQVRVPAEIFKLYDVIPSGAILADLDDPERCGCNPLASNKVRIELIRPATVGDSSIQVLVKIIKIGTGTKPPVEHKPRSFTKVRLYKRSEIPDTPSYYPINWKTYSNIWREVRFMRSVITDANGIAKFENIEKDDYIVLAEPLISMDFKHLGSTIPSDDPDWLTGNPIKKVLTIIEKFDKKKVPGKTKKLTGTELLITEPEFILWDSTQETYPFIFESVGDWGVVTQVIPPVGFEPDYDFLEAQVDNETEAVQFTITDVGTDWKPACATFDIKHKKEKTKLFTLIGIAREDGLQIMEDEREAEQECHELEQDRKEADQEEKEK